MVLISTNLTCHVAAAVEQIKYVLCEDGFVRLDGLAVADYFAVREGLVSRRLATSQLSHVMSAIVAYLRGLNGDD